MTTKVGRNGIAWTVTLLAIPASVLLGGCQPNAADNAIVGPEMSLAPAPTDVPTPQLEYPKAPARSPAPSATRSQEPAPAPAVADDKPTPAKKVPIPAASLPNCRPFQLALAREATQRRTDNTRDLEANLSRLESLNTNLTSAVKRRDGARAASLRNEIYTLRTKIEVAEHLIRSSTETFKQIQTVCKA